MDAPQTGYADVDMNHKQYDDTKCRRSNDAGLI